MNNINLLQFAKVKTKAKLWIRKFNIYIISLYVYVLKIYLLLKLSRNFYLKI